MKEKILDTIEDLCADFLYYDRKEDSELSSEDIKNAIDFITVEEMVAAFRMHLEDFYSVEDI